MAPAGTGSGADPEWGQAPFKQENVAGVTA